MYIKRAIEQSILNSAESWEAVGIYGPPRSGKTTLAKHLFPNHAYVDLSDKEVCGEAIRNIFTFLEENKTEHGIILDNIEHAFGLTQVIRRLTDKKQAHKGEYILLSSQNVSVRPFRHKLTLSTHTLLPLSIKELKNAGFKPELPQVLQKGLYPEMWVNDCKPSHYYKEYLNNYMRRHKAEIVEHGTLKQFREFLRYCAGANGGGYFYNDMVEKLDISFKGASAWMSLIHRTYFIVDLNEYYDKRGNLDMSATGLFFYDPGLLNFIREYKPRKWGDDDYLDTFIVSELVKVQERHSFWESFGYGHDINGDYLTFQINFGKVVASVRVDHESKEACCWFYKKIDFPDRYLRVDSSGRFFGCCADGAEKIVFSWDHTADIKKYVDLIDERDYPRARPQYEYGHTPELTAG